MYAFFFLLLNPGPAFVADNAPPEDVKKELAALQGTWQLIRSTEGGTEVHRDDCKKRKIVIEKDQLTVIYEHKDGRMSATHRIVVDPKQKPKTMDWIHVDGGDWGPRAGQTLLGIYSLEGDVLTICKATSSRDPRPKFLASPPTEYWDLRVYNRVRPEKKEKDKDSGTGGAP